MNNPDTPEVFATCRFNEYDVATLRENWTDEQCQDFLADNRKHIEDAMCRAGWQAMEDLLPNAS